MRTSAQWIDELRLKAHPEGGFYRQTYRSPQLLGGPRPLSTGIYYLLKHPDYSAFHKIDADEMWHLYAASPLTRLRVWRINPAGELTSFLLGTEPNRGEVFQDVVPAGDWFAAEIDVLEGAPLDDAYALVGCTVSPGFQFEEFQLADEALTQRWPEHAALLRRLAIR